MCLSHPLPLAVAEAGSYHHGQEEESLPPRWDRYAIYPNHMTTSAIAAMWAPPLQYMSGMLN
jgi:hypothetical protein